MSEPTNTAEIFDLGAYLNPPGDDGKRSRSDELVAYEPDTLTTHGVIVGMTGSGKTGLGIVLLEEALAAGVPTLVLDPKGDMGNLLLGFPGLTPDEFAPWVPSGTDATETATQWRDGLATWGLAGESIKALHDSARFVVYTPGSAAGVPLNILGSLNAPSNPDPEAVHDEVEALVSGLLGLVGIDADPLSSPEHILCSNIIEAAWAAGESLDMPTLLARIQDPPMRKLGVIEIDQFFPKKDRTALMMKLNGLLASPAFGPWSQGAPLDIPSILWDPQGRPSCSVMYLAHLSDEERQMVVSLVLSKLITWMRTQAGSTQLRVLVYMDEVYGFVPPTAAPPAKKPILTLYKQARAFGVGVVLATQNPVDMDYKAISNAGTWMIGRLQTERDKARLLEGLSSASGNVSLAELDSTISGLGKREFMLHTTGGKGPRLFGVRWAMSYLCGPLSKDQLRLLPGQAAHQAALAASAGATPAAPAATTAAATPAAATPAAAAPAQVAATPAAPLQSDMADDETPNLPSVADGVAIRYVDTAAPWANQVGAVVGGKRLQAGAAVRFNLLYDDERADFRFSQEFEMVLTPLAQNVDPAVAYVVDYDDRDLVDTAPAGTVYAIPDAPIANKTYFTKLQSTLVEHLQREQRLNVAANEELGLMGRPGETAEGFAARCAEAANAQADVEADKIRKTLVTKRERIQKAIETAERQRDEAAASAQASKTDELLGGAGSLLGALLGGRRSASSIASAVRGVANRRSKSSKASTKVETYEQRIDAASDELEALEAELAATIVEITDKWAAVAANITSRPVPLEKNDISVAQISLIWIPS